jgi:hypothetical protein
MTLAMDDSKDDTQSAAAAWSPQAKAIASVLVALHVAAVFIAPMAFAARRQSPAVNPLRQVFRPYIEALFLDHGYAFFAPDPGPSHLVEYHLEFDNGRQPETGRFPDINEHFPRLLYHRHFMLSESLQTYYVPAIAPPRDSGADEAAWRAAREQYQALKSSYERHLAYAAHAKSAEVHRIRHELLPVAQFRRERDLEGPVRLNDERTYTDLDAPPAPARRQPMPANREFLPGITPLPEGAR